MKKYFHIIALFFFAVRSFAVQGISGGRLDTDLNANNHTITNLGGLTLGGTNSNVHTNGFPDPWFQRTLTISNSALTSYAPASICLTNMNGLPACVTNSCFVPAPILGQYAMTNACGYLLIPTANTAESTNDCGICFTNASCTNALVVANSGDGRINQTYFLNTNIYNCGVNYTTNPWVTSLANGAALVTGNDISPKSHTNATGITISILGPATPFPSTIAPQCISGPITNLTVKLNAFSHNNVSDVTLLLSSPGGSNVMLFAGGWTNQIASGLELTFSDAAATAVPRTGSPASGTYRCVDYMPSTNVPGAPAGPYATNLSSFNGQSANGLWKLYVYDHLTGDGGSIAAWSLNLAWSNRALYQISVMTGGVAQVLFTNYTGFASTIWTNTGNGTNPAPVTYFCSQTYLPWPGQPMTFNPTNDFGVTIFAPVTNSANGAVTNYTLDFVTNSVGVATNAIAPPVNPYPNGYYTLIRCRDGTVHSVADYRTQPNNNNVCWSGRDAQGRCLDSTYAAGGGSLVISGTPSAPCAMPFDPPTLSTNGSGAVFNTYPADCNCLTGSGISPGGGGTNNWIH